MKNNILIEPFIRRSGLFFLSRECIITQATPFKLGFKITNIGNQPTKSFILKDIRFGSSSEQNIMRTIENSFQIGPLNPKSSTKLWVDKFGTYMTGLASIQINLSADKPDDVIEAYTKDVFTKSISITPKQNCWSDFVYVQSRTEAKQSNNNDSMSFYTVMMFLLAIFNFFLYYQYQVIPAIHEQFK